MPQKIVVLRKEIGAGDLEVVFDQNNSCKRWSLRMDRGWDHTDTLDKYDNNNYISVMETCFAANRAPL